MSSILDRLGDVRRQPHLLLLASACVLGTAYFFEFALGYEPCTLCLYQRLPWWLAIGVASLAIIYRARPIFIVLTIVAAITVLANAPLAGYHVGVEQGWWAGPSGCSGGAALPGDLSQMMQNLSEPAPRCDKPAWTLFGISMAGYNLLLSLAVGGFVLSHLLRSRVS